jgi:hypothetical protein
MTLKTAVEQETEEEEKNLRFPTFVESFVETFVESQGGFKNRWNRSSRRKEAHF